MKKRKLLKLISFMAIVILPVLQANAYTTCRVFDMKQEEDFRFGHAVLESPKLQSYIEEKGGIEAIWPNSQLCSSSNLNQVLKITLAFSRPDGAYVSWGWDYCQLVVTLRGTNVIDVRELGCDNAMEDH